MKHNMVFHNQCGRFHLFPPEIGGSISSRELGGNLELGLWNWKLATVSSVDAQWQSWVRSPASGVVLDKKVVEEVEEDMNEQERSTYRWQNH